MKVGFPYMGCVTGYKRLVESLGHEVVMPEKPTQRTVDLGVLNSPEFICYPFKVMLGTYIELCEKGVELIISSGGSGPCRAGMYCELHRRILKQLGYNVEIIIFDSMFQDFKEFMRKIKLISNGKSVFKIVKYLKYVYKLMKQMDGLEKELKIKRAYEINHGDFDKAWAKIVKIYENTKTGKDLKQAYCESRRLFDDIKVRTVKEEDRVRIGIIGEIYVIMESSVNLEMEKRLNSLGIEVTNVQYISDWLKHNIIPKKFNKSESWKMFDIAEEYGVCHCGGHNKENTGWIMEFAKRGYNGIVHLHPFGCLPELVTRSVVPKISDDLDIPILSVSLDEQMGEANLQTRVEAFVDLCKSKSKKVSLFEIDENKAESIEEKTAAVV